MESEIFLIRKGKKEEQDKHPLLRNVDLSSLEDKQVPERIDHFHNLKINIDLEANTTVLRYVYTGDIPSVNSF